MGKLSGDKTVADLEVVHMKLWRKGWTLTLCTECQQRQ